MGTHSYFYCQLQPQISFHWDYFLSWPHQRLSINGIVNWISELCANPTVWCYKIELWTQWVLPPHDSSKKIPVSCVPCVFWKISFPWLFLEWKKTVNIYLGHDSSAGQGSFWWAKAYSVHFVSWDGQHKGSADNTDKNQQWGQRGQGHYLGLLHSGTNKAPLRKVEGLPLYIIPVALCMYTNTYVAIH